MCSQPFQLILVSFLALDFQSHSNQHFLYPIRSMRVTKTIGNSPGNDTYIRAQLFIPEVTESQCLAFDILYVKRTRSGCSSGSYHRCSPLGKSSYADACDYRCLCEDADGVISFYVRETHTSAGLTSICEICIFDMYWNLNDLNAERYWWLLYRSKRAKLNPLLAFHYH